MFQSKSLWLSKDAGCACDDAHAINESRGLAAIADGVSGAMFSGLWARVLVQGLVENLYDPKTELRDWLKPLRQRWREAVDISKLSYFQQMKLQETGGAYSTLLWVQLTSNIASWTVEAFSFGDCCCFHLRDGQVLQSFPFTSSSQFDLEPVQIGSSLRSNDKLQLDRVSIECLPGDVLVLATDAISLWYFHCREHNLPFDWLAFDEMDNVAWHRLVADYRKAGMRIDDTTVVLMHIEAVPAASPDPQGVLTSVQARQLARRAGKRSAGLNKRRLARYSRTKSARHATRNRR